MIIPVVPRGVYRHFDFAIFYRRGVRAVNTTDQAARISFARVNCAVNREIFNRRAVHCTE